MIQFGFPVGFNGFHQINPAQASGKAPEAGSPVHTTANPTAYSNRYTGSAGMAALPVYPMALMPAYMMAYPQMAVSGGMPTAAGTVAPGAAPGAAADAGAAGQHVTANPTNSMAVQSYPGFGSGYGGGFGGAYGAMMGAPMMISPVLMQFGFPMFFAVPASAQPPAGSGQTVVDAPAVDDVPAPDAVPAPVDPAPVPTERPVIDVVPDSNNAPSLPTLPIAEVSADDFARYRLKAHDKSQESQLSLTLSTLDGDTVTLAFNQIDTQSVSRFRGVTLEGERMFDERYSEDTERVVNMSVVGEISAAEQAAIDTVLSSIVEAVQSFFSGDMGTAVEKLKEMNFDGQQLAELSLNMSMQRTAQVSRAYHDGADRLHDVKDRDGNIQQALEFMASEQKRLIDMAKGVLDTPSAAKLVRSLLPPLMSEPFSELRQQVADADPGVAPDTDDTESDDDTPAAGDVKQS